MEATIRELYSQHSQDAPSSLSIASSQALVSEAISAARKSIERLTTTHTRPNLDQPELQRSLTAFRDELRKDDQSGDAVNEFIVPAYSLGLFASADPLSSSLFNDVPGGEQRSELPAAALQIATSLLQGDREEAFNGFHRSLEVALLLDGGDALSALWACDGFIVEHLKCFVSVLLSDPKRLRARVTAVVCDWDSSSRVDEEELGALPQLQAMNSAQKQLRQKMDEALREEQNPENLLDRRLANAGAFLDLAATSPYRACSIILYLDAIACLIKPAVKAAPNDAKSSHQLLRLAFTVGQMLQGVTRGAGPYPAYLSSFAQILLLLQVAEVGEFDERHQTELFAAVTHLAYTGTAFPIGSPLKATTVGDALFNDEFLVRLSIDAALARPMCDVHGVAIGDAAEEVFKTLKNHSISRAPQSQEQADPTGEAAIDREGIISLIVDAKEPRSDLQEALKRMNEAIDDTPPKTAIALTANRAMAYALHCVSTAGAMPYDVPLDSNGIRMATVGAIAAYEGLTVEDVEATVWGRGVVARNEQGFLLPAAPLELFCDNSKSGAGEKACNYASAGSLHIVDGAPQWLPLTADTAHMDVRLQLLDERDFLLAWCCWSDCLRSSDHNSDARSQPQPSELSLTIDPLEAMPVAPLGRVSLSGFHDSRDQLGVNILAPLLSAGIITPSQRSALSNILGEHSISRLLSPTTEDDDTILIVSLLRSCEELRDADAVKEILVSLLQECGSGCAILRDAMLQADFIIKAAAAGVEASAEAPFASRTIRDSWFEAAGKLPRRSAEVTAALVEVLDAAESITTSALRRYVLKIGQVPVEVEVNKFRSNMPRIEIVAHGGDKRALDDPFAAAFSKHFYTLGLLFPQLLRPIELMKLLALTSAAKEELNVTSSLNLPPLPHRLVGWGLVPVAYRRDDRRLDTVFGGVVAEKGFFAAAWDSAKEFGSGVVDCVKRIDTAAAVDIIMSASEKYVPIMRVVGAVHDVYQIATGYTINGTEVSRFDAAVNLGSRAYKTVRTVVDVAEAATGYTLDFKRDPNSALGWSCQERKLDAFERVQRTIGVSQATVNKMQGKLSQQMKTTAAPGKAPAVPHPAAKAPLPAPSKVVPQAKPQQTAPVQMSKRDRQFAVIADPNASQAERNWYLQQARKGGYIKNYPGTEFRHHRGFEAEKLKTQSGVTRPKSFAYSEPVDSRTHKTQHKIDGYGAKQPTPAAQSSYNQHQQQRAAELQRQAEAGKQMAKEFKARHPPGRKPPQKASK